MNDARRKEIARAQALVAEARSILTVCQDEEQDYYDNMPESLQSGDKGQAAEQAAASLEEAGSNLESALADIETAIGS